MLVLASTIAGGLLRDFELRHRRAVLRDADAQGQLPVRPLQRGHPVRSVVFFGVIVLGMILGHLDAVARPGAARSLHLAALPLGPAGDRCCPTCSSWAPCSACWRSRRAACSWCTWGCSDSSRCGCVTGALIRDIQNEWVGDRCSIPFCGRAFGRTDRYWSAAERNTLAAAPERIHPGQPRPLDAGRGSRARGHLRPVQTPDARRRQSVALPQGEARSRSETHGAARSDIPRVEPLRPRAPLCGSSSSSCASMPWAS